MSYVIDIDEKGGVILRPGCLGLCPALLALSHEEVIVLALVYDNHSTLRRYNELDRIRRAILQVYGDNVPKLLEVLENPVPNHRITNAVNAYKSLQYNRKAETINKYNQMIDDLRDGMNIGDGAVKLKKDLESMDMLSKSINQLEKEWTDDIIAEGVLKGGQENSLIEIWQKNIKNWEAIKNKRPSKI